MTAQRPPIYGAMARLAMEGRSVFDKISRSWSLAGQCWTVLKEDPALLVFPLLSSIVLLILLGSFALPMFAFYHSLQPALADGSTTHTSRLLFYITMYAFYFISYRDDVFQFGADQCCAQAARR
jgi:hypothetical protein